MNASQTTPPMFRLSQGRTRTCQASPVLLLVALLRLSVVAAQPVALSDGFDATDWGPLSPEGSALQARETNPASGSTLLRGEGSTYAIEWLEEVRASSSARSARRERTLGASGSWLDAAARAPRSERRRWLWRGCYSPTTISEYGRDTTPSRRLRVPGSAPV